MVLSILFLIDKGALEMATKKTKEVAKISSFCFQNKINGKPPQITNIPLFGESKAALEKESRSLNSSTNFCNRSS